MTNLIDNAIKYGKDQGKILVELEDDKKHLQVSVEDDGPGLPEDKRAQALKRGQRLDETKPGSGLGLSIVAETAAMYNGSVRLEDAQLGGLRAVLILPAAA